MVVIFVKKTKEIIIINNNDIACLLFISVPPVPTKKTLFSEHMQEPTTKETHQTRKKIHNQSILYFNIINKVLRVLTIKPRLWLITPYM